MPTSNFTTEKAFKNTKINIKMVENPPYMGIMPVSHHLKMIMCDEPNGNVIAFCGGLDLSDGRLDGKNDEINDRPRTLPL